MPTIDFYVLADSNVNARFTFACRLIEKAYKTGHRIYIHTENTAAAHAIDELLWTYRDDSFLPHNLYGEGPAQSPPIQIGCALTPEKHRDILLNLSDNVPAFFKQFNRILEITSNDTKTQDDARERFRFYRKEGAPITTHKLETVE
jgi:DNA polymerase-3 subunit chi